MHCFRGNDHFFRIQWLCKMNIHSSRIVDNVFCKEFADIAMIGTLLGIPSFSFPDCPCRIQTIHPRHHNIHINYPKNNPVQISKISTASCPSTAHVTSIPLSSSIHLEIPHVQLIVFHNQCPHAFYRIIIKAYWLI